MVLRLEIDRGDIFMQQKAVTVSKKRGVTRMSIRKMFTRLHPIASVMQLK